MKKSLKKADWLRYDHEAETMTVTGFDGRTARYSKGLVLQPVGGFDLEVAFVGFVVRFNEMALRVLPERILVTRLAEPSPVTGLPLAGASDARFEFVRRDRPDVIMAGG